MTTDDYEDEELYHYGIARRSGRYPWGSGGTSEKRSRDFQDYVKGLKDQGLSQTEIARGVGLTTTQLRNTISAAKAEVRAADVAMATRLKEKGLSQTAIGERMGINESSVRSLLNPMLKDRNEVLSSVTDMLRQEVEDKKYLDIGLGVENSLGISQTKLNAAVQALEAEGYQRMYVKVAQLGTGNHTSVKVLVGPDVTYSELYKNQGEIRTAGAFTDDGGRNFTMVKTPPVSVDSKRVDVRYAKDGGADMDGVIQIRRGAEDLSMGSAKYAQVRVAVDGTHYLKGMAVYADDLPPGVDIRFNTNKSDTGNKLDAMKGLKDDEDRPFGSVVRQLEYVDAKGKTRTSALNIVNEEGDWSRWGDSLSSQMLSKQPTSLAKQQLDYKYEQKRAELDDILALTNPTVRKTLLASYADSVDSSAVHLKAAALPRQATKVLLPIPSAKPGEIYAPQYNDGEVVALVRFPHGGKFEIPELRVNNKNPEAQRVLGNSKDAVGIHPSVAQRLSGADFDGDTVLVIPNTSGKVRTSPALVGLKDFDPQSAYPRYEGMPKMSAKQKQAEMGNISNLITDMTIRGANQTEIARAVRHSMVVIDAEKHDLNYKQSFADNGIADLKVRYQGGADRGASTLISRSSSSIRVNKSRDAYVKEGGRIDPETGARRRVETGETYVDASGATLRSTTKSTRMAETSDARTLSSGTPMEQIYADHANKLKSLGNQARKAEYHTKKQEYSPSAAKVYASEVASLSSKLNTAMKNRPRERQAQILANAQVNAKRQANPDMEADELKKVKSIALAEARVRVGAKKTPIDITPTEWEAIQAGAVSAARLKKIMDDADLDVVKQLATPRERTVMTSARMTRAKALLAAGYTDAEVAASLGVPVSTLTSAIEGS